MPGPVTRYDASNHDRLALRAWRTMFGELRQYHELIYRLVFRNMASQFRQSFLGYLWIVLPPIATAVVFTVLRKAQIVNVPMADDAMPYALFVLVGTTVWGYFTQLTLMATGSISVSGNLVSKIYFPREVLVLSAVGNAVINTLIRIGVVVLAFAVFRYLPHSTVLAVPLLLIPLTLFAVGLGLFFAPINTMAHDMGRVLEFVFQFGMFLTPTIYPTPSIAAAGTAWEAGLYWLHSLNPVTHYIHAIHDLIQYGTFNLDAGLIAAMVISVLTFFMGWRFFHACEPLLAERL